MPSIRPILAFWESKVHKMFVIPYLGRLMNRRAKCDAASFNLGGKIRNRTNIHKKHSNRYMHTLPIGMYG